MAETGHAGADGGDGGITKGMKTLIEQDFTQCVKPYKHAKTSTKDDVEPHLMSCQT